MTHWKRICDELDREMEIRAGVVDDKGVRREYRMWPRVQASEAVNWEKVIESELAMMVSSYMQSCWLELMWCR